MPTPSRLKQKAAVRRIGLVIRIDTSRYIIRWINDVFLQTCTPKSVARVPNIKVYEMLAISL